MRTAVLYHQKRLMQVCRIAYWVFEHLPPVLPVLVFLIMMPDIRETVKEAGLHNLTI